MRYFGELPNNIKVCTIHSFIYQEFIKPYYFLLYGKQYERISSIKLPDKQAYKAKKIAELDDRGIIHVTVLPQRAKWVVVKKSSDKKKEKNIREEIIKTFSCYCQKIFIDEAQDINDDIAEIIKVLDAKGISFELVGDPKQDLRGNGSFRKLVNEYNGQVTFLTECLRCPQKHLNISNRLIAEVERQKSQKTNGIVEVVFESDIQVLQYLEEHKFDLSYISQKNERFETHTHGNASTRFETLNHELVELLTEKLKTASRISIARGAYCIANRMIKDLNRGMNLNGIIKKNLSFFGMLEKKTYGKIIGALQVLDEVNTDNPVVSSIESIKGQEGNNCLFILTSDLAPYLFMDKVDENKVKNKLYVALTRSLDKLTILITVEVEIKYSKDFIYKYFCELIEASEVD